MKLHKQNQPALTCVIYFTHTCARFLFKIMYWH